MSEERDHDSPFCHSRALHFWFVILSSAAKPRAVEELVLSEAEGTPKEAVPRCLRYRNIVERRAPLRDFLRLRSGQAFARQPRARMTDWEVAR
jgi:hypothetical protein